MRTSRTSPKRRPILNWFPTKYVRDPASGAVYLLREGLKHHVATQYTMDTLGMSWANVVNHDRWDRVPDGFDLATASALAELDPIQLDPLHTLLPAPVLAPGRRFVVGWGRVNCRTLFRLGG